MVEDKFRNESKLSNDLEISKNSKSYSYLKGFSKNDDFPPVLFLESEFAATSHNKAALFKKFFILYSVINRRFQLFKV